MIISSEMAEMMRQDRVFIRRIYNKSTYSSEGWAAKGEYKLSQSIEIEERSALYVLPYKPSGGGIPYSGLCTIGSLSYSNSALPEPLIVGRYCSIGSGLVFLDSSHPTTLLTTSILGFRHDNILCSDLTTKEEIAKYNWHPHTAPFPVIEHDVWIGQDVTLAMGIKIGTGAIIGAGSVVTKDVPPYAIVAGNPAQIKKYRFTEHQIEKLLNSSWWDCHPAAIAKFGLDDIDKATEFAHEEIASGRKYQPIRYIMDSTKIERSAPKEPVESAPAGHFTEPMYTSSKVDLRKDVAFCTIVNDAFIDGAVVLANSLKAHCPGYSLFALDAGLSSINQQRLSTIGVTVVSYPRAIPYDHPRFGPAYALFDIGNVPYETVIYLDADTVVIEDIGWLIEAAHKAQIIASRANAHLTLVRPDYVQTVRQLIERSSDEIKSAIHSISPTISEEAADFPNLNSGVLAIKTSVMRKLAEEAKQFDAIYDKLPAPDQELLSLLLCKLSITAETIPWNFNATYCHGTPESKDGRLRQVTISDLKDIAWSSSLERGVLKFYAINRQQKKRHKIHIIHFITKDKPWIEGNNMREDLRILWKSFRDR